MRLDEVMPGAPAPAGGLEIADLAYDTRRVSAGTLFFCVPGFTSDGHEFAGEAIAHGAVALVVERPLASGVPEIQVESVRAAMAPAAARFFGDPTANLKTVGVTGTNGKTTSAFLLRALLEAGGLQAGLLGTVKSVIGGIEHEVVRTTPEAIDLQRTFRTMLDAGDRACAMEVSSHALELHRADSIHFAAALFTNLTQDHLDFHGTMEEYFAAKRRLFVGMPEASGWGQAGVEVPGVSVINVDDDYGLRLAAELPEPVTFALDRDATFRAVDVESGLRGSRFVVDGVELRTPLRGRFNVYNALGAFATARVLGIPQPVAARAIESAPAVPGRFEPVDEGQEFAVLVDYAHTPDSLQNVLQAARDLTAGQVHVVFGCGGDRDRGKRPLMGEIARRLADRVVVTSDNPRSEDPEAIVGEILAGAGDGVESNVDRRAAIAEAIAAASPGDIVVIAGKGHEQGQEFAHGHKIPFDDRTVAREILRGSRTTLPPPVSEPGGRAGERQSARR
jgi:UDP-N-acetylmuramoyl-L-alanyl-D-glutamate--2,6-diaminopimelate ligase